MAISLYMVIGFSFVFLGFTYIYIYIYTRSKRSGKGEEGKKIKELKPKGVLKTRFCKRVEDNRVILWHKSSETKRYKKNKRKIADICN